MRKSIFYRNRMNNFCRNCMYNFQRLISDSARTQSIMFIFIVSILDDTVIIFISIKSRKVYILTISGRKRNRTNNFCGNCIYIPLEKINCTLYFSFIVTIKTHLFKTNYIFWKPMEFSITLYIYLFSCIRLLKNNLSTMQAPSCPDSQRLDFVTIIKISFFNFLSL